MPVLSFAVSQVEQIVYSTESSLDEENDAIVKQVVATHNKAVQSGNDETLRKFRSMPHVMRSFFQSGSSGSSSNGNTKSCSNDGKPLKMCTLQYFIINYNVSASCRYRIAVLEKEV